MLIMHEITMLRRKKILSNELLVVNEGELYFNTMSKISIAGGVVQQ